MTWVAVGGSGTEALLTGAVARAHALTGTRDSTRGFTADPTLPEWLLPGTQVLAALPGTSRHWRLRADRLGSDILRAGTGTTTETTYWENGTPAGSQVMVTATGLVDGSAWQERGGLAGLGPDGFAQGGMSDGMFPGPLLEVLTEQAVIGSPRCAVGSAQTRMPSVPPGSPAPDSPPSPSPSSSSRGSGRGSPSLSASAAAGAGPLAGIPGVPGADGVRRLTDDELLGAMSAAQRLRNRSEWLELSALAEFTRRRYAQTDAAIEAGHPGGQRAGEFASEEVAYQAVCSGHAAEERMELAAALAARLPATFVRMADGAIGSYRALITHRATRDLSAENVAIADAIIAAEAPFLTPEALRRRAVRVAMTLDPDVAEKRRKQGVKHKRVEMWQEESGNAALAGREMDPADALAATAYYDALARALRKAGHPGTLRELRHLAYTDRNTGKDPLDRITARPGQDQDEQDATTQDGNEPQPGGRAEQSQQDPGTRGPGGQEPGGQEPGQREPGGYDGLRDDGHRDALHDQLRDDGYRDDEPGEHGPWDDDDRDDENSDSPEKGGLRGDGRRDGLRDEGYRDALRNTLRDDGCRDDEPASHPSEDNSSGPGNSSGGNDVGPVPVRPAKTGSPAGDATAPVPANITVLVPVGTLLGWSAAPGEASRLGPLDPQATRDLIQAASRHPNTRWCVTLTGDDGTAVGHGCAPGHHAWTQDDSTQPDITGAGGPTGPEAPRSPGPPERTARITRLLDWLGVIPEPIARGSCDHRRTEDRYVPSRKLAHLIRARTATCSAPSCGARAEYNDLDHTTPWPGGPTDECNLAPACRHHHRVKQAPGWKLQQPEPGIMRWTTPSGRVHTTRPTVYDVHPGLGG